MCHYVGHLPSWSRRSHTCRHATAHGQHATVLVRTQALPLWSQAPGYLARVVGRCGLDGHVPRHISIVAEGQPVSAAGLGALVWAERRIYCLPLMEGGTSTVRLTIRTSLHPPVAPPVLPVDRSRRCIARSSQWIYA